MALDTRRRPEFDLGYKITDYLPSDQRDSQYLYAAIEKWMVGLACEAPGGRALDVACGTGKLAMLIGERDVQAVGCEASDEMIGIGRYVQPESPAMMVRSIAEELPFADASFDRLICQGSLDHFADPAAFMREAARVIKPGGRIVIGLANFESVSCRLGRARDRLKRRMRRPLPPWRKYYEIPEDHNVKGDLPYVRALGGDALVLDRCFGISLLWLFATYSDLLDRLPERWARRVWHGLDRVARERPRHADMIVSVWRKP